MNNKLILGLVLSLFLVAGAVFASAPDPADVVAYYKFDENTGTTAGDSTPNGNDGTITGATWTTGKINSGLSFDGTNDYVTKDYITFDGAQAYSFWMETTQTDLSMIIHEDTGNPKRIYFNNDGGSGEIQVLFSQSSSSSNNRINGNTISSDFNDGSMNHVFIVIDDTATGDDKLRIYKNGISQDVDVTTSTSVGTLTGGDFYIGGDHANTRRYFDGVLDEFAVFDVSGWTSQEIEEAVSFLYASGSPTEAQQYPFPIPAAPEEFSITARDVDTSQVLTNITVTLSNGTIYQNQTGNIVNTLINESILLNFSVHVPGFFEQSFTNINTSNTPLQANLTKYPYILVTNRWDDSGIELQPSEVLVNGDITQDIYKASIVPHSVANAVYLGLNTTANITINRDTFFAREISHNFVNKNNLVTEIWQGEAVFNATKIITGEIVSPANFTLNTTTQLDEEVFYINTGSYNAQFTKTGWFGLNKSVTIQNRAGFINYFESGNDGWSNFGSNVQLSTDWSSVGSQSARIKNDLCIGFGCSTTYLVYGTQKTMTSTGTFYLDAFIPSISSGVNGFVVKVNGVVALERNVLSGFPGVEFTDLSIQVQEGDIVRIEGSNTNSNVVFYVDNLRLVSSQPRQFFTIDGVSDNAFEITINNFYNSSDSINNFSVFASNNQFNYQETYTTTSGVINVLTTSGLLLNLTFAAPGFHNTTYLNYDTTVNLTGEMFPTDQILMRFYSASSGALINQNINVRAEDENIQRIFNFNNGIGLTDNLPQGESYFLTINTTGFLELKTTRVIPVPNLETPAMDFYLLVDGEEVTFRVLSRGNQVLSDALIEIERFINGTYQLVGSAKTDISGIAKLVQQLDATHKITIIKEGYITQSFIVSQLSTEYEIFLESVISGDISLGHDKITFSTSPNKLYWVAADGVIPIRFNINSPEGVLSHSGIKVMFAENKSVIYQISSNAVNGGTYAFDLDISGFNNTNIIFEYFYTIDGLSQLKYTMIYFIADEREYSGSLLEFRDWSNANLSINQKLSYIVMFFVLSVIITAIFIRGVANIGISLSITLGLAWVLGINLFIISTVALVLFMVIFSQSGGQLS